ncbi:MAG: MotA/TolQ/ExbB proton channel family protein [Spirochaetaceae bacterium]|nr:MAG: MotA/TolQ/ExbB proton channel family protein [Spirochaetaceae bacterium]
MLDLFLKGGILMWPLLLCSITAFAVIAERTLMFLIFRDNNKTVKTALVKWGNRDAKDAVRELERAKGPVSVFLKNHFALSSKTKSAETAIPAAAKGDEILLGMNRGLHLLSLIERVAPMLGFLGTVTGMVDTFHKVYQIAGPVSPSTLASGIWEALITTVAGLSIAIPALVALHFMEAYVDKTAEKMKRVAEIVSPENRKHV